MLTKDRIKALLPYGQDFLFLESASVLEDGSVIEAVMQYSVEHPLIAAHFQNGPHVVPGVLLLEQICQSALLLGLESRLFPEPKQAYLGRVKSVFKDPAVAPCVVKSHVKFERIVGDIVAFQGQASVGDRQVAKVEAISANVN